MRLAWYAGASTALAASVVSLAFHQRANFYSAMVYFSQSSFCLIVLVNFILMTYMGLLFGLQRLCFGQLRPIEREQLYERTWYAITETLLAMTMFRDEMGAWFLVMFTALVSGRIWSWVGEGRVEVLEQQPPANARLFHARLIISLAMSLTYDFWILRYVLNTVIDQAKPTMMLMFLFEFAVLSLHSLRTTLRYIISVHDYFVVAQQTRMGLARRRRDIRSQRAEILRRRETEGPESDAHNEELPNEEDVDEIDIEVPGWESKGLYILGIELTIDLLKCVIYTAFFVVLIIFYTMPLHILRDLFLTFRSLIKRINAIMKYRKAVRDMDRYGDASEEDLARENTCIICRENMRPWQATPGAVERNRPKKLPCGHILHFGCLKSWLERQQVCPTCRRSVTETPQNRPNPGGGGAGGEQAARQAGAANQNGGRGEQAQPRDGGMRVFHLGPIRLGFAQGNPAQLQEMANRFNAALDNDNQQPIPEDHDPPEPREPAATNGRQETEGTSSAAIRQQLQEIEQRIQHEINALHQTYQELNTIQLLVAELSRIRRMQNSTSQTGSAAVSPRAGGVSPQPQLAHSAQPPPPPNQQPPYNQYSMFFSPPVAMMPSVTRHVGSAYGSAIPAGSPALPEGVVIPPGWSLMPLQRIDAMAQPGNMAAASLQSSQQISQLMQQHLDSLQQNQAQRTQQHDQQQSQQLQIPSNNTGASQSPPTAAQSQLPSGLGLGVNDMAGPSSSSRAPEEPVSSTEGSSAPEPTSQQRQESRPSEITAPTPVVPSWGGRAQLFGAPGDDEAGSLFVGGSGEATGQEQQPCNTGVDSSSNLLHEQQRPQEDGAHDDNHDDVLSNTAGGTGGGEDNDKGKARAVTVDDASDEDD